MREINLKEYTPSVPIPLSHAELMALRDRELSLSIVPASEPGTYRITPGSIVGSLEMEDLSVIIRPKIDIPQLLSIACYAMSRFTPQKEMFNYPSHYELPDVIALALTSAAQQAFSQGILHGYLTREEAMYTVRGRIRFDDQIRRRFGIPLPIEVRYEEFTDDILANRLVKAAALRLGAMRLREARSRSGLNWIAATLDNVSPLEFRRQEVPEVTLDRLGAYYIGLVELSRLILQHSAYESSRGDVRANGFLMDMNRVFQEFVTVALREELRLSPNEFRERTIESLDVAGRVDLEPDLVWRSGSSYVFVGDAKYKDITGNGARSGDLYQLLAYITALDLPGGMLVYAAGESESVVHEVRHCGKRLEIATLDMSGTLDEILENIRDIARRVRALSTLQTAPHSAAICSMRHLRQGLTVN